MRVVMVVPRRDGVPERDRSWAWVRARWERLLPDIEIVEGHHLASEGEAFNISAARNRAAAAADVGVRPWDIAIFADSDTFCAPQQLLTAVEHSARTGEHTIAFTRFRYLSEAGSELVMAGPDGPWRRHVEFTYMGGLSSLVVVPRFLFDAVGGWDERFVGWGEEDAAFAIACHSLKWPNRLTGLTELRQIRSAVPRVDGDCWHLWHPLSTTNDPDLPGYMANVARRERYVAAAGYPEKILELVA